VLEQAGYAFQHRDVTAALRAVVHRDV
jgi:NAD dependent epimerase/dehydratase family enzyme